MKKLLLFSFILASLLVSCTGRPSIYDLQQQSLASGIHRDTVFGNLTFGLKEEDAYKALGIYKGRSYRFAVDEIKYVDWSVSMHFYNDSLYMISFTSLDEYRFYDIEKIFTVKYGTPAFSELKKDRKSYYWFSDNVEINIDKTKYAIHISYEDISRDTRNIIRNKLELLDVYTPEYYEVRSRKEDERLKGI